MLKQIYQKIQITAAYQRKAYKPTDMWTLEDNLVFLKYCPDPKMVCYHALAIAGARPHEILALKIEDIIWSRMVDTPDLLYMVRQVRAH